MMRTESNEMSDTFMKKGTRMNYSDEDFVLEFAGNILKNDTTLKLSAMDTLKIVEKNHAGNGYFSWDGILDDLAELIDYEAAREILGNC